VYLTTLLPVTKQTFLYHVHNIELPGQFQQPGGLIVESQIDLLETPAPVEVQFGMLELV
jgi:hypothetical protein